MLFAFQCGTTVPPTALRVKKQKWKNVQRVERKTLSGTQTFPSQTGISSLQIKNNHTMKNTINHYTTFC
jgi:hypothetical protein